MYVVLLPELWANNVSHVGQLLTGMYVTFITGKHGYVFSSEKEEEITEEK